MGTAAQAMANALADVDTTQGHPPTKPPEVLAAEKLGDLHAMLCALVQDHGALDVCNMLRTAIEDSSPEFGKLSDHDDISEMCTMVDALASIAGVDLGRVTSWPRADVDGKLIEVVQIARQALGTERDTIKPLDPDTEEVLP